MTLLDRLRAATGPSRELDADVARAVGWTEFYELVPGELRAMRPDGEWDGVPDYTGSVDCALSLMPDDHPEWGVEHVHHTAGGGYRAWSSHLGHETAATPALALCCAALQARGVS